MPNVNCAVVGCSNSSYHLKKWKKAVCLQHGGSSGSGETREYCGIERPFHLFCFPSVLRNNEQRQLWINALKRDNVDRKPWEPTESDRVCSKHFQDGEPSLEHPVPSLFLGYNTKKVKERRQIRRRSLPENDNLNVDDNINNSNNNDNNEESPEQNIPKHDAIIEHSYCKTDDSVVCLPCNDKRCLIMSMGKKLTALTNQVKTLKLYQQQNNVKCRTQTVMSWKKIKTDKKMNFYTGLSKIEVFNAIFMLLKPYLPHINYWKGSKRTVSTKVVKHTRAHTHLKKLAQRDEFLLTLMRLRLNLLNEDLADRFGISTGLCSQTFTTWIKIISRVLGTALIVWLPRESIRDNLPNCFREKGYSKCRIIIDCTEVFIERPKSLELQYATWSEYKHHNTIKFLVGISPSGFISFLSDCYGGRKTDKFITQDSGFYENLERDDEIMADRGFQIQEELLHYFCRLIVPPGKRAKSQMTEAECLKTKTVANLRIHIERAINRMKYFRILKSVLPISMLQHVDDIIRSCAALCNLKPALIQTQK